MSNFEKAYLYCFEGLNKFLWCFYKLMLLGGVLLILAAALTCVWVWFIPGIDVRDSLGVSVLSVGANALSIWAFKDDYLRWYELNIENPLIMLRKEKKRDNDRKV